MDSTDMDFQAGPARKRAAMLRDVCVLLNGASGNSETGEMRRRIAMRFSDHGVTAAIRVIDGPQIEKATHDAVAEGFNIVVAAGGDGTISGVAGALAQSGCALGVLPLGTFNFVARGFSIPENVEDAVDVIAAGHTADFPLGEVNDQVFLNNASLGLYPHILKEREGTYNRFGRSRIAAHWSVLKSFLKFREPLRMKVIVDGKERRRKTPLAFIGRSAFQLDHYGLSGAEAVRDGNFALILAPDSSRWKLFARAIRLARKGTVPSDFELISGREIVIKTSQPDQTIAMDGERTDLTGPFHFRLHDDWLKVIVPEATISDGTAQS
ncbi:diacylglycerol/lipid kinase family protein [Rhodalgimonas zhirmunskyi]|nr:diacylglycerol kinase family protein [Rhodoalgimonas zhirmunskyi]